MISPSNPGQDGSKEVMHDGMNDAGHEAQFKHADRGESISDGDCHEGSGAQTSEERSSATGKDNDEDE